jgi:hypothetical protein
MPAPTPPRHVIFDPTPEIFATDGAGSFWFPLQLDGQSGQPTSAYDEARLLVSIWHPSGQRAIDLDRAYVESRVSLDQNQAHWFKLAEIEPVVPPYDFHPRARIQVRASAYFVA